MSHPLTSLTHPQGSFIVNARPSFLGIASQIYSHHGILGFFRGLTTCLVRAFPVNACAFFVYEGTMRVLGAEKVSWTSQHVVIVNLCL